MVMYPEVQARAQRELDKVLRQGQLPTFGDREMCPYIECLVQEVLRYAALLFNPICHPLTNTLQMAACGTLG